MIRLIYWFHGGEIGDKVINKRIIQSIRDHEMNREEFLRYVGVVLVGTVGIKTALNLPGSSISSRPVSTAKETISSRKFGNGKFGT